MRNNPISRIKKKSLYLLIVFILIGVSVIIQNTHQNLILIEDNNQYPRSSAIVTRDKQWIVNSDFSDPIDPWYYQALGDTSDVVAGYIPGEGYYRILGEERLFSGISGTPLSSDWTQVHNPEFPLYPDTATINSEGCFVSHEWAELADQTPSVHWERNISMPVDMHDYIITSASLTAIINATVTAYPGAASSAPSGWGVEAPGDNTGPFQDDNDQFFTGDYVRFYVLLSDLSKSKTYEVAFNQTRDLGKDSAGAYDYMYDTYMNTVSQEALIFYLTSVLSSDYKNFTITLGMRIWCEDNWWSDRDRWDSLLIKSFNLSFTYQKKVDQFTKLSWSQIGDRISGQNISILEGNLRFKYKIDQIWPTILSPNSRLNILINNNSLLENVKLSTALSTFQEARLDGFDVTKLILKDVNISLSIELFLGDTFPLSHNYTISITDVYLRIIYNEFVPETEEQPWFFAGLFIISSIAAVVLTGLFIAYVKVWRFPIPIRKVRKHKKALSDEKDPDVRTINRDAAFKRSYHGELDKTAKILKGEPLNGKIEKEKLFGK